MNHHPLADCHTINNGTIDRRALIASTTFGAAFSFLDRLGTVFADESAPDSQNNTDTRLRFDSPQTQHWRIGLVLETPVTCTDVYATFPVPTNWPEQNVTIETQMIDPLVRGWEARDLANGVKQVALQMPRVPAGSTVEMTFTFRIERSRILPPEITDDLVISKRPDRALRNYLGNSPHIDASNGLIRSAWRKLSATEVDNDWKAS